MACRALRPFPGQTQRYWTVIVSVVAVGKCRVGLQIIDPIVAAAAGTLVAEDVLC